MRTAPLLTCVLLFGAAQAAEPAFTKKPTAARDGEKVKIEFAVDRETDVAVYVEKASGEIVRHLVAGALGLNPPPPLKAGLSQSVEWDGKDDDGRQVSGVSVQPFDKLTALSKVEGVSGTQPDTRAYSAEAAASAAKAGNLKPETPLRVRVGLGLKASWAGTAFFDKVTPDHLANVCGLAAGPDGRVYVLSTPWGAPHWTSTIMHVFRRDGSYERTIKPPPAHLPAERLKGIGAFRNEDGHIAPITYRVLGMTFYPYEDVGGHYAVTPDNRLLLPVRELDKKDLRDTPAHLAMLDSEGGTPEGTYAGPELLGKSPYVDPYLASASDGKAAFLTGLKAGPQAVYRVPLPERGPASVFFGEAQKPGNGKTHLSGPSGLASDGKGNLLVADTGNNRVVVLKESDGSFAGSFPVATPSWLAVAARTGAVYVCSKGESIVKFAPVLRSSKSEAGDWEKPEEAGRFKIPPIPGADRSGRARWFFALDGAAEPAVLWLGFNTGRGSPLMRCEERGGTFSVPAPAGGYESPRFWNLTSSPLHDEVSCQLGGLYSSKFLVLDEANGKVQSVSVPHREGETFQLGPNRLIYSKSRWIDGRGIARYDRAGKAVPFTVKDEARPINQTGGSGFGYWERGFCVDRRGNIYVKAGVRVATERQKSAPHTLDMDRYDPDGRFLRTVVWGLERGGWGPRVDGAGNIYVAEAIRPAGKACPDGLAALLPDPAVVREYGILCGSLIQFGPKGGAALFAPAGKPQKFAIEDLALDPALSKERITCSGRGDGDLIGARWWRNDYAPVADASAAKCTCVATEFDVDDFGRSFYPDQGRWRMMVRDAAGNQVLAFGGYGNQDHCGPDSYVPDPAGKFLRPRQDGDPKDLKSPFAEPEIAFAWAVGLAVSDRHLYVADGLNRRMLRVKLDYAATETVVVP
jgi:outer membrane protein assembly factor BamB